MKRLITFTAVLFVLFASCATGIEAPAIVEKHSQRVITKEKNAQITETLRGFVQEGKVVGISALIYQRNKEVYFGAFGYADREAKRAMNRNTLVKIYSMTKPITGVALMTLYERGLFDLDDPVEKYAPEFANMQVLVGIDEHGTGILEDCKRPMTIRDLTRHTAGFANPNNHTLPGIGSIMLSKDPMNRNHTLGEMAAILGEIPLMSQPGSQWEYGICVDVQAYIVEKISGMPYHDYVRKHVLDRLGMRRTRYYIPEEDRHSLAAMYHRDEAGQLDRVPDSTAHVDYFERWPLTRGGSGLTAPIDEYMRFARMLVNHGALDSVQILQPHTVQLMATNHLDDHVEERSWLPTKGQVGFGIDFAVRLHAPASSEENQGVVGEFFWDGAASTLFWVDPVNQLAAVLFVQLMPYDGIGLHKQFRDAVYGVYREEYSQHSDVHK